MAHRFINHDYFYACLYSRYSYVTWAERHLKLPVTWLFVEQLVQANTTESINALHDCTFVRGTLKRASDVESVSMPRRHHVVHRSLKNLYRDKGKGQHSFIVPPCVSHCQVSPTTFGDNKWMLPEGWQQHVCRTLTQFSSSFMDFGMENAHLGLNDDFYIQSMSGVEYLP